MEEKLIIKTPRFIIFTDIDGTLNLNDEQLNIILASARKKGGMVIPITGRTIEDVKDNFRRAGIKIPEILIGDNGAGIYFAKENRFLQKKILEDEKVKEIIRKFLENGGKEHEIRVTDGLSIHAINNPEVQNYYAEKESGINYYKDIIQILDKVKGITKITLAGSEELMKKMEEFVNKLDFWSDRDKTKFPKKEAHNFRLDIAAKNINKGEAVETILGILKPQNYICIGNGYNDETMFKKAVDDKMTALIMPGAPEELIGKMKQYAKGKKGRVEILEGKSANKAILNCARKNEKKNKESYKNLGTKTIVGYRRIRRTVKRRLIKPFQRRKRTGQIRNQGRDDR